MLYLDLFFNWPMLVHPMKDCIIVTMQLVVSFSIGLLPGIDNFAHIGGFVTGILASCILTPKIFYSSWDKGRKIILMIICFPILVGLFLYGFLAFYSNISSTEICSWCKYLDCPVPDNAFCQQ
ncbi:hypothetical protein ROZALSC1DRAFT_29814 [Rozella allomycis CSF55]|uniref:Peptidase S54 rhomboid domain-containing protein n=1 Tax=Rozella allomycis (strain CSF55) TaxID=988480 RepID=A0A4P9YID4_ROZAC|nr:hypothetical protein ROZALSC1DRAFT_29814 [Rozella allomycis CSF55]